MSLVAAGGAGIAGGAAGALMGGFGGFLFGGGTVFVVVWLCVGPMLLGVAGAADASERISDLVQRRRTIIRKRGG